MYKVDPDTGIVTIPGTGIAFESSAEIPYFLTRCEKGIGWTASRPVQRWKYDATGRPVSVTIYGSAPV